MYIYSNDNIRKIAKLTTRELPQKSKMAKITVRENNGLYSTLPKQSIVQHWVRWMTFAGIKPLGAEQALTFLSFKALCLVLTAGFIIHPWDLNTNECMLTHEH